jgi:hypothetical protein
MNPSLDCQDVEGHHGALIGSEPNELRERAVDSRARNGSPIVVCDPTVRGRRQAAVCDPTICGRRQAAVAGPTVWSTTRPGIRAPGSGTGDQLESAGQRSIDPEPRQGKGLGVHDLDLDTGGLAQFEPFRTHGPPVGDTGEGEPGPKVDHRTKQRQEEGRQQQESGTSMSPQEQEQRDRDPVRACHRESLPYQALLRPQST